MEPFQRPWCCWFWLSFIIEVPIIFSYPIPQNHQGYLSAYEPYMLIQNLPILCFRNKSFPNCTIKSKQQRLRIFYSIITYKTPQNAPHNDIISRIVA